MTARWSSSWAPWATPGCEPSPGTSTGTSHPNFPRHPHRLERPHDRHRPDTHIGRRRGWPKPKPAPSWNRCCPHSSSRSGGATVASGCRHRLARCASAGSTSCTSGRDLRGGSFSCASFRWSPSDIRCPRPTCGPTCSSFCTTIPGASSPPPTGGLSTAAAGDADRPRFRCRQARADPAAVRPRSRPEAVRQTLSSGSSATDTSCRDPLA